MKHDSRYKECSYAGYTTQLRHSVCTATGTDEFLAGTSNKLVVCQRCGIPVLQGSTVCFTCVVPYVVKMKERGISKAMRAYTFCPAMNVIMSATGEDIVSFQNDKCSTTRRKRADVHVGRAFGFCAGKGAQLPKGHHNRLFKHRVVFQGNDVKYQNYECALCQDLGSNPASMQAVNTVDCG